jgi:hypothetical protein
MHILYKPLFDWWNNNNGKQYKNRFNMNTFVAANYSLIFYYLSKLSGGPLNHLNINQFRFIIKELLPHLRFINDKKQQQGLIIPKHLCESVLITTEDGDVLFNQWYKASKKQNLTLKEGAPLKYTQDPAQKQSGTNLTYYTYTLHQEPKQQYFGVYPQSSTDTTSWTGLALEWLGPKWAFFPDADGILQPKLIDPKSTDIYDTWFQNNPDKSIGRPDNFLARMGLLPTSPLFVYYINNKYSTQSMKIDAQAFQNLIHASGSANGGWTGFLLGISHADTDDYENLIKTTTDFPMPTPPQCKKGDATKGILSGIVSFIGIAAMAVFAPEAAPLIIAGALVAGGISGYQAGAGTC